MSYAQVLNGTVRQVGLPQTGTLSNGKTITNYD